MVQISSPSLFATFSYGLISATGVSSWISPFKKSPLLSNPSTIMFSISTWAALLLLATVLLNVALPLAQNVRIAQASGIPYVCVPYYAYNRLTSMFMGRTFLRLADKVAPGLSATSWRHLVKSNWPWKFKHAPFTALQTDTFLTVSPGGIIMHTADANVIAQIIARGEDFPKATQLYRHVDIYGKNVVSSGGATWRRHRAVTSPAFTEKNNQLVWKETLDVTQAVLASWTRGNSVVHQLAGDSMRLSLEVIGRAGLGQKLEWPKATESADKELPPGHTMSFTVSVQFLLANMLYVMALPMWFLSKNQAASITINGSTDRHFREVSFQEIE
jgi:hypothetical protein